ncbi:MAG: hypothetical protein LBJ99_04745 [Oscillospiraceae bacterium]|jgi:hypothetical protein|nr:hypothetical protein [Oscillospiraceae bacterium]
MLIGKTFVDPLEMPFSRRGSYISFANQNGGSNQYGKSQLWISTSRIGGSGGAPGDLNGESPFRQIQVELVKDGIARNCVYHTTPYELIFECELGSVRFCIGDYKYARCRGTDGLSLRLSPKPGMFGMAGITNLHDGTFKTTFGSALLLFVPEAGTMSDIGGRLELAPDKDGVIDLVMEEWLIDPKRRGSYMSYDECVANVKADFDGFAARLAPDFPEKYKERGMQAVWTVWGLTVIPDGETPYKRQMIKMMRIIFEGAFSWQQGMHAFFLAHDPELSWEVLLSSFDVQDANGRIADSLASAGAGGITMKPPVQGLGLLWQMEHFDISKKPKGELEYMYDGLERWTNFYLNFRDVDGDGIFENQNAGETGWEDGSYQRLGFPIACPDMNAYLALQEEALAKLGRVLGKDESVNAAWEKKSKDTIAKIIELFWTEGGWVAMNAITKEKSEPTSLLLYCALLLGKRLPQHIIDRSIELIFEPGAFDTQYGLASEKLDSPLFHHGWCSGSLGTPVQALLALALEYCGRKDLSNQIAVKYLDTLKEHGLYHIHNPFDGTMEYQTPMFFGERSLFFSGWTAGCFLFFAERYTN